LQKTLPKRRNEVTFAIVNLTAEEIDYYISNNEGYGWKYQVYTQQDLDVDMFYLSTTEQVNALVTTLEEDTSLIRSLNLKGFFRLRDTLDNVVSIPAIIEHLTGYRITGKKRKIQSIIEESQPKESGPRILKTSKCPIRFLRILSILNTCHYG
jgi:hypothetical protein